MAWLRGAVSRSPVLSLHTGSSFYHIHDNFIYGEGLKQDYGGHDSSYVDNVNVVHKYDGQNCMNTWPFLVGHTHNYTNNTCVVLYTWDYGHVGQMGSGNPGSSICDAKAMLPGTKCALHLAENRYYTPWENCTLKASNSEVGLAKLQAAGVELGSVEGGMPSNDEIVKWGREKLGM